MKLTTFYKLTEKMEKIMSSVGENTEAVKLFFDENEEQSDNICSVSVKCDTVDFTVYVREECHGER